ncbi:ATP-binding protein [Actinoplanes sp. NPDC020271]|uniref:ATP-binding protein n=1 Tax=Actinoplanes sp. NPDC020271 TaxID=3363896 RepID=UPI0037B309B6
MNPWKPAASEAVDKTDLPLAAVPAPRRTTQDFTAQELPSLRHAVHDSALAYGLTGDVLDDFVIAVHELATNAVRHGGGRGTIDLHVDGDTLLCDIRDHGPGFPDGVPATAEPPSPQTPGGRGLWLARHLTDTLMITDGPGGVTVSITACLPAPQHHGMPTATVADEQSNAQVEISPGVIIQATSNSVPAPHPLIAAGPDTAESTAEATGSLEG